MAQNKRSWTLNHALRVLGKVQLRDPGCVGKKDCAEVERILEEAGLEDIGTSRRSAADEAWYKQHLRSEESRKKQAGLPTGMHYADASIDGRESDLDKYDHEDDEETEYLS